jgi:biotin-(acetyl-CoA carboxylase) ligase
MKYNFVRFKEIDSTNNEAKRYVSEGGVLPVLLLAERQTEGRGEWVEAFIPRIIRAFI